MPSDRVSRGLSSIAANIRRLRLKRGWTQEELAEGAGLETRYVQTLESRKANPSAATLIAVAHALHVDPGALFRPAALVERKAGRPKRRALPSAR
jgi:transcriptional regulator with XRE-family HTH domain